MLGVERQLQLLRLPTADGRVTYAEWMPPLPDAGAAPAVLLTLPYDGIDWSGEEVDSRWASRCPTGTCALADTDGPGGGPDAGTIVYQRLSPQDFASQDAAIFLYNGAGALGVHGRFYAGGSWWQYAQDMVAGLRFLGTRPDVDRSRIGVYGGSLGGYEAFYAAAYAPAELQPRAVVPMFPPVDLAGEMQWALVQGPGQAKTDLRRSQFAAFFDPYVRRAVADTGGRPGHGDFRCFDPALTVPRVSGDVLVIQDDWDLLVAPALSSDLLEKLGARGHALWYLHPTPPDVDNLELGHGPFDGVDGLPTRSTFMYAFLLERLKDRGEIVVPYDLNVLTTLLTRWRDQSRSGLKQPGAAERLGELADPRVVLYEINSGQRTAGPTGVSMLLSSIWGVIVAPEDVQRYLAEHGLPP